MQLKILGREDPRAAAEGFETLGCVCSKGGGLRNPGGRPFRALGAPALPGRNPVPAPEAAPHETVHVPYRTAGAGQRGTQGSGETEPGAR